MFSIHEFYKGYCEDSHVPHDVSETNNRSSFISSYYKADDTVQKNFDQAYTEAFEGSSGTMSKENLLKALLELSKTHALPTDPNDLKTLLQFLDKKGGVLSFSDYGQMLTACKVTIKGQPGPYTYNEGDTSITTGKGTYTQEAFEALHSSDGYSTLNLLGGDTDHAIKTMDTYAQIQMTSKEDTSLEAAELEEYITGYNQSTQFLSGNDVSGTPKEEKRRVKNWNKSDTPVQGLKTSTGETPFTACKNGTEEVFLTERTDGTYAVYKMDAENKLVPADYVCRADSTGALWIVETSVQNDATAFNERIATDYASPGAETKAVRTEMLNTFKTSRNKGTAQKIIRTLAAMDKRRAAELLQGMSKEELLLFAEIMSFAETPYTEALGTMLTTLANFDSLGSSDSTAALALLKAIAATSPEVAAKVYTSMDASTAAHILEKEDSAAAFLGVKNGKDLMSVLAPAIKEEQDVVKTGKILEKSVSGDMFFQNSGTTSAKKTILAMEKSAALKALLAMDPRQAAEILYNATPEELDVFAQIVAQASDDDLKKMAALLSVMARLDQFGKKNGEKIVRLFAGVKDKKKLAQILSYMDQTEAVYIAKLLGHDLKDIVLSVNVQDRIQKERMAGIMNARTKSDRADQRNEMYGTTNGEGTKQAREALLGLAEKDPEAALKILCAMNPREAAEVLQDGDFNMLFKKASENAAYTRQLGLIFTELSAIDQLKPGTRTKVLQYLKNMEPGLAAQILAQMSPAEALRLTEKMSTDPEGYRAIITALCKNAGTDGRAAALLNAMVANDTFTLDTAGGLVRTAMLKGTKTGTPPNETVTYSVDTDALAALGKMSPENACRVLAEMLEQCKGQPEQQRSLLISLAKQGAGGAKVLEQLLLSDWGQNEEAQAVFDMIAKAATENTTESKELLASCATLLAAMDSKASARFIRGFAKTPEAFAALISNAPAEALPNLARTAVELVNSDWITSMDTNKLYKIVLSLCKNKDHAGAAQFINEIAKIDPQAAAEIFRSVDLKNDTETADIALVLQQDALADKAKGGLGHKIMETLLAFDDLPGEHANTKIAIKILSKMEHRTLCALWGNIGQNRGKLSELGNKNNKDWQTMIARIKLNTDDDAQIARFIEEKKYLES